MKRLNLMRNALFLCASAVLLAGCAGTQTASDFSPMLDESFETDAAMEYGSGQTAQLHITRYGSGLWDAAFSEPNTLSGVVLTFEGNAVSASYKGLEFSVPKSALTAKNMLTTLTDALENISSAEQLICTAQEDGTWSYSAECESGSFTLTFAESGEPLLFELPSQPLKITFSDYICRNAAETDATDETAVTSASECESQTTASDTAENSEGTSN